MFSLIAGFVRWLFEKTEVNILILGLDNAGKTTLLEQSKSIFAPNQRRIPAGKIPPTVGLNIARFETNNVKVLIWDLGGQVSLRTIWKHYYDEAHAIIYVVDSSDQSRLSEVREALEGVTAHEALLEVPVLIAANKQDLPNVLSTETLALALGMGDVGSGRRPIEMKGLSALTKEGIDSALRWAIERGLALCKRRSEQQPRLRSHDT